MLENSLQDIILLWQEFGLDDHFHLSFLPAQAQVLEAESYFLTLYLPFETVFQLELLDMALSLNKFRLELLGYDTKLLRDGWTASPAAGTPQNKPLILTEMDACPWICEKSVTHLFRLARRNPALAETLCSTVNRWLCLSYYSLQNSDIASGFKLTCTSLVCYMLRESFHLLS